MPKTLKVAAAIVKETFTHPLTRSVIYVNDGNVTVERVPAETTQEQAPSPPQNSAAAG
jgi:hypothetical protein